MPGSGKSALLEVLTGGLVGSMASMPVSKELKPGYVEFVFNGKPIKPLAKDVANVLVESRHWGNLSVLQEESFRALVGALAAGKCKLGQGSIPELARALMAASVLLREDYTASAAGCWVPVSEQEFLSYG